MKPEEVMQSIGNLQNVERKAYAEGYKKAMIDIEKIQKHIKNAYNHRNDENTVGDELNSALKLIDKLA